MAGGAWHIRASHGSSAAHDRQYYLAHRSQWSVAATDSLSGDTPYAPEHQPLQALRGEITQWSNRPYGQSAFLESSAQGLAQARSCSRGEFQIFGGWRGCHVPDSRSKNSHNKASRAFVRSRKYNPLENKNRLGSNTPKLPDRYFANGPHSFQARVLLLVIHPGVGERDNLVNAWLNSEVPQPRCHESRFCKIKVRVRLWHAFSGNRTMCCSIQNQNYHHQGSRRQGLSASN